MLLLPEVWGDSPGLNAGHNRFIPDWIAGSPPFTTTYVTYICTANNVSVI